MDEASLKNSPVHLSVHLKHTLKDERSAALTFRSSFSDSLKAIPIQQKILVQKHGINKRLQVLTRPVTPHSFLSVSKFYLLLNKIVNNLGVLPVAV